MFWIGLIIGVALGLIIFSLLTANTFNEYELSLQELSEENRKLK